MVQNDLQAAKQALSSPATPGPVTPMTSPTRYLIRMLFFMVAVGAVAVLLLDPLLNIFAANPALNGLILGVLVLGIAFSIRQVLSLRPEVDWIKGFRPSDSGLSLQNPPKLLAPMAAMMTDRSGGKMVLSTTSMRTLLDGIETRLVEARELSRYMIGLLVFLGLLGTFWGLLETVSSVGQTIKTLGVASDDFSQLFTQLQTGLEAPLNGMGLAFSSSLLGLAGSLVLGFLDLQSGQAQNRFYNDLEEWLSGFTKLNTGPGFGGDGDSGSVPAYVAALLEQTAESLDKLQRTMAREEDSRRAMDQSFTKLSDQLARMAEGQADLRPALTQLSDAALRGQDPAMAGYLRNMDTTLLHISEALDRNRDTVVEEMRSEIKLLARTIANVAESRR